MLIVFQQALINNQVVIMFWFTDKLLLEKEKL